MKLLKLSFALVVSDIFEIEKLLLGVPPCAILLLPAEGIPFLVELELMEDKELKSAVIIIKTKDPHGLT